MILLPQCNLGLPKKVQITRLTVAHCHLQTDVDNQLGPTAGRCPASDLHAKSDLCGVPIETANETAGTVSFGIEIGE